MVRRKTTGIDKVEMREQGRSRARDLLRAALRVYGPLSEAERTISFLIFHLLPPLSLPPSTQQHIPSYLLGHPLSSVLQILAHNVAPAMSSSVRWRRMIGRKFGSPTMRHAHFTLVGASIGPKVMHS